MPEDPYSLMGLEIGCTEADIKRAYRRMARLYHPDLNRSPQALETMKRINAAYAVLSDAEQRRAYDLRIKANTGRYGAESTGRTVEKRRKWEWTEEYTWTQEPEYSWEPPHGPAVAYDYTAGYVTTKSRLKMYAIFLLIFFLSSFYLFLLPYVL